MHSTTSTATPWRGRSSAVSITWTSTARSSAPSSRRGSSWRRYLYLGTWVTTPTIVFRRELLARAPLLNESYADAADYDFFAPAPRRPQST